MTYLFLIPDLRSMIYGHGSSVFVETEIAGDLLERRPRSKVPPLCDGLEPDMVAWCIGSLCLPYFDHLLRRVYYER